MPTVLGVRVYDFALDINQELVQLVSATLGGEELELIGPENVNAKGESIQGKPSVYALDRLQFALTEYPQSSGLPINTAVILKPSLSAAGVGDEVFRDYAQDISKGALATLLLLPGETFNQSMAGMFRAEFNQAIGRASFHPSRNYSRAILRVKPAP